MYALDLVWSRRPFVPLLSASSARHCGGGAQASCGVVWCAMSCLSVASSFQIAVSGKKGVG